MNARFIVLEPGITCAVCGKSVRQFDLYLQPSEAVLKVPSQHMSAKEFEDVAAKMGWSKWGNVDVPEWLCQLCTARGGGA